MRESTINSVFLISHCTIILILIRSDAVLLQNHEEEQPEDSLTILIRRRFPELQAFEPLLIASRKLPIGGQFLIEENEYRGLVLAYNPEEQEERATISVCLDAPDDVSRRYQTILLSSRRNKKMHTMYRRKNEMCYQDKKKTRAMGTYQNRWKKKNRDFLILIFSRSLPTFLEEFKQRSQKLSNI